MDDYSIEKSKLTSDFNEGKFQIFRLNEYWGNCARHSRNGNLQKWNWELDVIHRELSVDEEQEDDNLKGNEKYAVKFRKLNQLVGKHKDNSHSLYKILFLKETLLRKLQDDAGKGAKRSDSSGDDIDD